MSAYDRTEMWGYLLGDRKDFSLGDGCRLQMVSQVSRNSKKARNKKDIHGRWSSCESEGKETFGHTGKDEGLGGLAGAAEAEGR